MAQGFETDLAVKEQTQGWGSSGGIGNGVGFKELDSFSSDPGIVQNRRTNKISRNKTVDSSFITNDFLNPVTTVTFQPRAVELLPFLMSHYQCVEVAGGTVRGGSLAIGTFRFAPAADSPDFVGSTWGTFRTPAAAGGGGTNYVNTANDVYPLVVETHFGTLTGMAPQGQMRFFDAYVDSLSFTQEFDGDLQFTMNLNHKGVAPGITNFPGTGNFATNTTSSSLRFSGWTATVAVDGTANSNLDIEALTFNSNLNGRGRGRLGQYGFGRFDLVDDEITLGMRVEFKDANIYKKVLSGSTFQITNTWIVAGQNDWVKLDMPTCKFRPVAPSVDGGDQTVEINYEAEGAATNGTPAIMWSVFATYAATLLSLDVGAGTVRT